MHRDSSSMSPAPGDYVVLYASRTGVPNARLTLVRWSAGDVGTVIRTTFESPEDAGPRFEAQARLMARASGHTASAVSTGTTRPWTSPMAMTDEGARARHFMRHPRHHPRT